MDREQKLNNPKDNMEDIEIITKELTQGIRLLNVQGISLQKIQEKINKVLRGLRDPIDDALNDRLNHKDIVEYGYQMKDGTKVPLKWSYMEIDDKKYFVCTDIIARHAYSESCDNRWENSDLKKALDKNLLKLYCALELPLGEDSRIDGGITILSTEQYSKIRKDLPKTHDWYWLSSHAPGDSFNADYVYRGGYAYRNGGASNYGGVRPIFRLKSKN